MGVRRRVDSAGSEDAIANAIRQADWDTAVQGLRSIGAGPAAPEDLRENLAICLANRAAQTAGLAMTALAPDEAARSRAAAEQALNYLFPGSGSSNVPGRARRWKRRLVPHRSASLRGILTWVVFLSPVWIPMILVATGAISDKTAGLVITIAYFTWFGGSLLLALAGRLTAGPDTSSDSEPGQQRTDGSCELTGCHGQARYEIPLGRIMSESGRVTLAAGQEPPSVTLHLCATHAHGLEEA